MKQESLFEVPKSQNECHGFYGAFYEELLNREEVNRIWEYVLTNISGWYSCFQEAHAVILLDTRTGEILADKMIEHLWVHNSLSNKVIDGIITTNSIMIRDNLKRINEGDIKMPQDIKLTKLKARVDVTISEHVTDNHPNDKTSMSEGIFQAVAGCSKWSKILDDYTVNKFDIAKRLEEIEHDLLKIIRGADND